MHRSCRALQIWSEQRTRGARRAPPHHDGSAPVSAGICRSPGCRGLVSVGYGDCPPLLVDMGPSTPTTGVCKSTAFSLSLQPVSRVRFAPVRVLILRLPATGESEMNPVNLCLLDWSYNPPHPLSAGGRSHEIAARCTAVNSSRAFTDSSSGCRRCQHGRRRDLFIRSSRRSS